MGATTAVGWDPSQYARYDDERGRPFADLLSRVRTVDPALVVDLGCGHGPLTLSLADRWPGARIVGIDSSAAMLDRAAVLDSAGRVEWVLGDVRDVDWRALGAAPDVVVTNATLQWVPGHLALLPALVRALRPGGWFAMQVPGNADAPSHVLLRETVAASSYADVLLPRLLGRESVGDPASYAEALSAAGCRADAWETTYLHLLDPNDTVADPVLEWTKGTALRPVLDVVTDQDDRADLLAAYAARLTQAYPRRPYGVPLPFRRVFAVGRLAEEDR